MVLCYHRVADEPFDPWGLCVRPDHFAGHLDAIVRSGRTPVTLAELRDALRAGRLPRRAVVITFDDGYADNLEHAAPALSARGLPATVFVTTGLLGGTPWWDELADIVVRGAAGLEDGDPAGPREEQYLEHWRDMQALAPSARDVTLERLRSTVRVAVAPGRRMLDEAGLRELAGLPGMTVGAHTVSHPSLPSLEPSNRQTELEVSRCTLEDLLHRSVDLLAYPFGDHDDATVADARRAGFTAAVTTRGRPVLRRADPHRIPRISVSGLDPDAFAARLAKLG